MTVLLTGARGGAGRATRCFVSDFTSTLSSVLELSVALLGPSIAIYAVDIVLRRNSYDGAELHNQIPTSAFWFSGA